MAIDLLFLPSFACFVVSFCMCFVVFNSMPPSRDVIEKRSMLLAERRDAMQKLSTEDNESRLKETAPEERNAHQPNTGVDSCTESGSPDAPNAETAETCAQKAQITDQEFYEKLLQVGNTKQAGLFKQIDMDVKRTHPPQYEKLFDSPRISFVRFFTILSYISCHSQFS